jgi:tetratricopeptide (TPR) repeat protein
MKRVMGWMAAAATLSFVVPAAGGQEDPRLDGLFDRLQVAGAEEAHAVEAQIWQIWTHMDDPAVDRLMTIGINAMAAQKFRIALAAFDEVVSRKPGFAEGWNKRATVYYLLGEYDRSVEDVEKTLALEPRHFGALSGLGLIALALGEEARALDAFEAALKIHPHMSGAETRIRELRDKLKGRRI